MDVLWTEPARNDLRIQLEYLLEQNPVAAQRLEAAVFEAVALLADFPQRGRPGRREGTRELVINRLPYLLVYRVRESSVRILRLFHTAQNRPSGAD